MLSTDNSIKVMSHRRSLVTLASIWLISSCSADNPTSMVPGITPEIGAASAIEQLVDSKENIAPAIQDTSFGCDPITESVVYTVGDTDTFTLTIEDEFPDDLNYQVDISQPDVVDVSVDEHGIFSIKTIRGGETYLWFSVSDQKGLMDEYELHVIVE